MKRLFVFVLFASMFIATVVFSNPPINKDHLGLNGADKAKVNCVYCHKTAGIKKAKDLDKEALKKGKLCKMKDCH